MFFQQAVFLKSLLDGTHKIYQQVEHFDSFNNNELKAFIDESFNEVIKYSVKHVPYYRNLFSQHGYSPNNFTSPIELDKLPYLTKDLIRSNYSELRSDELTSLKYITRRSGGTTGEPIMAMVSREANSFETFSYFRGLKWMGWKPEMTMVKLFGGSLNTKKDFNLREFIYKKSIGAIFIPAFDVSNASIYTYYSELKNKNKICILGYASAINNLVNLLKENNLILTNVALVITTSEQLAEDWKLNIMDYFDCQVRSYYGCGEVESLGYQLSDADNSYRIPTDNAYIGNDSETNELVITQLHNKAQPFIKFKNGDLGELDKEYYASSIKNLIGRTSDYFFKENGEKVSPIFGTYSIQFSGIKVRQYQYIQYLDGVIEFRYIMEFGDLSELDKKSISGIVNYVMGEKVRLVFSKNKMFEVNSSLKHRICVRISENYDIK